MRYKGSRAFNKALIEESVVDLDKNSLPESTVGYSHIDALSTLAICKAMEDVEEPTDVSQTYISETPVCLVRGKAINSDGIHKEYLKHICNTNLNIDTYLLNDCKDYLRNGLVRGKAEEVYALYVADLVLQYHLTAEDCDYMISYVEGKKLYA